MPGTEASEGEVALSGGRVRTLSEVRMLWTETARYGPRKRGYHGGAAPQEMLCSLALFAPPGVAVEGWSEGLMPAPSWWEAQSAMPALDGQLDLFEEATARTVWDALQQHPATKELVKKQEGTLQPLVRALVRCGGGASLDQLTQLLGLTETSLRLSLQVWLRQLKVDGQPVLALSADGQRVALDMAPLQGG